MRRKWERGRRADVPKFRVRKLNGTRDAPSATHAREHIGRRLTHGVDCGTHALWNWTFYHALKLHATRLFCPDGDGVPRPRTNTKPLPQPSPSSWGPGDGGDPEAEELTARDPGPMGWSAKDGDWAVTVDGDRDGQGAHDGDDGGCNGSGLDYGEGDGSSGMDMGGTVILSRAAPVMPLGIRKGDKSWSAVGILLLAFLMAVGIPTVVFYRDFEDQVIMMNGGYCKGTGGGRRYGARVRGRRRGAKFQEEASARRMRTTRRPWCGCWSADLCCTSLPGQWSEKVPLDRGATSCGTSERCA